MKKIIIIVSTILLTACACVEIPTTTVSTENESYRIYDEGGNFAGSIDGTSRIYDRDGNFIGMIRR